MIPVGAQAGSDKRPPGCAHETDAGGAADTPEAAKSCSRSAVAYWGSSPGSTPGVDSAGRGAISWGDDARRGMSGASGGAKVASRPLRTAGDWLSRRTAAGLSGTVVGELAAGCVSSSALAGWSGASG
jgi:hypothetical protein